MTADLRERARDERHRGRRTPATEPGEIPGQLDMLTALDTDTEQLDMLTALDTDTEQQEGEYLTALTVRPPWSEWLARGVKRVENRCWPTRHRGPLVVHAGTRADPRGWTLAADLGVDPHDPVTTGALVAVVTLVDCHWSGDGCGDGCGEQCDGWAEPEAWHWVVTDARRITPVAWRGQLGLHSVPVSALTDNAPKGHSHA